MLTQQNSNKIQLEQIMQNIDNIKDDIRNDAERILMQILINEHRDYRQQKRIVILAIYNYKTKKFKLVLNKNCSKASAFISNHYPKLTADEVNINNDLIMVFPMSKQDILTKYIDVDSFTDAFVKLIKRKAKQIIKEWNLTALHPTEHLRTIVSFLNLTVDVSYNLSFQNINRTYFIPLNAISAKELTQIIKYLGDAYDDFNINFYVYPFKDQFKDYFEFQQLPSELANTLNNCKLESTNALYALVNFINKLRLKQLRQDIQNKQITKFNFQEINQKGLVIKPNEIHKLALQSANPDLIKSYIEYYLDYNQAEVKKISKNENLLLSDSDQFEKLSFTSRYNDYNDYNNYFNSDNTSEYLYIWLDHYYNDVDTIKRDLISDMINEEPAMLTVRDINRNHVIYFVSDIEKFKKNMKLAIEQISGDNPVVQQQLINLIKNYSFQIITVDELMNDKSIYEVQENLLPDKLTFLRVMSQQLCGDDEIREIVDNRKIFIENDTIVLHKFN